MSYQGNLDYLLNILELLVKSINPATLFLGNDRYVAIREIDGLAFLLEVVCQLASLSPGGLGLIQNGERVRKGLYGGSFALFHM
jgi:hypothetical protein